MKIPYCEDNAYNSDLPLWKALSSFLVSTTLSFSMVPRAASSTVAARHRTARHWGRGTALAPQRRPPAQTRLVLPLGTLNRYPALYRTYSLCRTESNWRAGRQYARHLTPCSVFSILYSRTLSTVQRKVCLLSGRSAGSVLAGQVGSTPTTWQVFSILYPLLRNVRYSLFSIFAHTPTYSIPYISLLYSRRHMLCQL